MNLLRLVHCLCHLGSISTASSPFIIALSISSTSSDNRNPKLLRWISAVVAGIGIGVGVSLYLCSDSTYGVKSVLFTILCATLLMHTSDRKRALVNYCITYILSCITKHSPQYRILMVGRILVSKAVFLGNGLVAILAGLFGNLLVGSLAMGPVAPFDAASIFLAIGKAGIISTRTESYGDPTESKDLMTQFKGAVVAIASGFFLSFIKIRYYKYSSIPSVHPEVNEGRSGTFVIESFVVDIPDGNTKDDTCYFVKDDTPKTQWKIEIPEILSFSVVKCLVM
ncbi:Major facilitator superfamily domain, general substrate transporter [Artemisia annua]|uniref:Major facilitator superfamily domain, general substrate transporter n=1 Tax=Artemisia annua TaxID=35608 RepID=A0A2U1NY28_ARTAN|nr:Major facilitator superfamily domain, general substrate transporter [Artemisia annua]